MGKFDKEIEEIERLTFKVKDHEKRLRTLEDAIDNSKEGFGILNKEGKFVFINEAYAELFGGTIEDLIGKSWKDKYNSQSTIDYIHNEILPLVNKKGTWSGIVRGEACTGKVITQVVTLTKFNDNISCHTRQIELFNIQ